MVVRTHWQFALVFALCCSRLSAGDGAGDDERGLKRDATAPVSAELGEHWALLIGIDAYEHLSKLEYCGRDMEALRDALIANGGYQSEHIRLLGDAPGGSQPTRGNIFLTLTTFLQQMRPEDTVLVAFAGHGESDAQGASFLVPIDGNTADRLLELTCVPMSEVYAFLEECPARQKVLILDCCHSGGTREDGAAATTFAPGSGEPATGLVELLSCRAEEVSHEHAELQHGVFSYFLVKALEGDADLNVSGNRDGLVSVGEAYDFVYERVAAFIEDNYPGHRQSPVKRGEEQGPIILSARSETRDAMSAERIVERLMELQQQQKVSSELVSSARRWLSAGDNFPPAGDMHLLLSLLVQELLTEQQFLSLGRDRGAQIDSHLLAAERFSERGLRGVCIGINEYPHLGVRHQLKYAAADAQLLADTISSKSGGGEANVCVLTNAAASAAAIRQAIEREVAACGEGDILFISFSGQGGQVSVTEGDNDKDAGNPLVGCFMGSDVGTLEFSARQIAGVRRDDAFVTEVELEDWVGGCAGHVVIISDTNHFYPSEWTDRMSYATGGINTAGTSKALFAVGTDHSLESQRLSYGRLTFAVAQGLAGAADQYTPQPAVNGDALLVVRMPDGFVTLLELQKFLMELEQNQQTRWQLMDSPTPLRLSLRGQLGPPDVVLTTTGPPGN